MLATSDEDKIVSKSCYENISNTESVWDNNILSEVERFGGPEQIVSSSKKKTGRLLDHQNLCKKW